VVGECGVNCMRLVFCLLTLVPALGAGPAPAQIFNPSAAPYPIEEQKPALKLTPKPAPKRAEFAPAAKAAAKSATAKAELASNPFAGIPAEELLQIESALLWSGDYGATASGEDPMLAAVKSFQKRAHAKVTGTLTPTERASLVAAAKEHEQNYGWSVVVDPATGARIGLPTKLTPLARDAPRGTRWSSAHGEIRIETFRVTDAKLVALFEQEKKELKHKVESSALHANDFMVSGMQGLKMFLVKAQARGDEVRGFTLLYDQALEGIVAPVAAAMSNAFTGFPEHSAPFATPAKPVEYGTGLIASGLGYVVTDRKLVQQCQVIVVKGLGNAERVADDPGSGLALLRVYGAHKLPSLPLTNATPKPGDVALIGMPDPKDQDGRKLPAEIKARLAGDETIDLREPVPMAGFSGAAAIDGSGVFLGIMEMRGALLASAQPAPPLRLVPARTIRAFLEARDIAAEPARGADARASVLRVICVRK
jgi:hypothetical protein